MLIWTYSLLNFQYSIRNSHLLTVFTMLLCIIHGFREIFINIYAFSFENVNLSLIKIMFRKKKKKEQRQKGCQITTVIRTWFIILKISRLQKYLTAVQNRNPSTVESRNLKYAIGNGEWALMKTHTQRWI